MIDVRGRRLGIKKTDQKLRLLRLIKIKPKSRRSTWKRNSHRKGAEKLDENPRIVRGYVLGSSPRISETLFPLFVLV